MGTIGATPYRHVRRTPIQSQSLSAAPNSHTFLSERDQNFADRANSFPPDCGVGGAWQFFRMSAHPQMNLSPEDKLDILQRLDEFHFWHSLDDRRFCTECRHSITGWDIQVIELTGTRGRMYLRCPTDGCLSSPSQWIYADPVLAAALRSRIPRPSISNQDASLPYQGHVLRVHRARHHQNATVVGGAGGFHAFSPSP